MESKETYEQFIENLKAMQKHMYTWDTVGAGDIEILTLNNALYHIKGLTEIFQRQIDWIEERDAEKKTSEEWQEIYKDRVVVYDPDGWDRVNYQYSWYEEKISENEFNRRVASSTCKFDTEYLRSL